MLTNALEIRALRETLRNQAIRKAVEDIDAWRETQTSALITDLVSCITCSDPNFENLARNVGNLDPRIEEWVDSIRTSHRQTTIKMITQESIEDCLIPYATEFLETAWMRRQSEITAELGAKSEAYETQLQQEAETDAQQ